MKQIPRQVTFRGLSHSPELDGDINARIDGLARFYDGIVRCLVVVEVPHRHQRDGSHVQVRIEVSVPGGGPIVVNREPSTHGRLKDLQEEAHHKDAEVLETHRHASVAVREAFDTAERRLEDFASGQRGVVRGRGVPEARRL